MLKMKIVFCFFLIIHFGLIRGEVINRQDQEEAILKSLFSTGKYNIYIRPQGSNETDGSTKVKVNMFVLNFEKVKTKENYFNIHLYFRQEWTDDRLKYDYQVKGGHVSLNDAHVLWTPDLFFVNEKVGNLHNMMKTNNFIKLWPNGRVQYSARISLCLFCQMDLRKFPFDVQICNMRIESYGHQQNELTLEWKDDFPVGISSEVDIPEFKLLGFKTEANSIRLQSGNYSYLNVQFVIKRESSNYFSTVFIPSTLIIIFSYLSFFISPSAVAARLIFVALCTLLLFIQNTLCRFFLPILPYTTALDVWNGVCTTFVFLALLEYIYVHHLLKYDDKQRKEINESKVSERKGLEAQLLSCKLAISKMRNQPERIDTVFRILFPILFIAFNIVYWSVVP